MKECSIFAGVKTYHPSYIFSGGQDPNTRVLRPWQSASTTRQDKLSGMAALPNASEHQHGRRTFSSNAFDDYNNIERMTKCKLVNNVKAYIILV